jgi:hypothetical protein
MHTPMSPKAMLIAASEDTVGKFSSSFLTSRARGEEDGAQGPQGWSQKREIESLVCTATPSIWTQELTHIENLKEQAVAWMRVPGNF